MIIILALIGMWVGSELNQAEVTPGEMYNLSGKVTYDSLNATEIYRDIGNDQNNTFFLRAAGKYMDFIAFIGVEGIMESINFGYKNPQYNFNLAWRLLFITLFAWLIVPLIQVILFIGYGIYALFKWIKPIWIKYCMKNEVKKPFTN